jgi:hypothetical protein
MSTCSIGNVEIALPPGVKMDVNDGVVQLHFSKFTGSITLTPKPENLKRSASEEVVEEAKRARLGTPADEGSDASGAPAAISALRTMQHDAFFRNGGGMSLSQDSDEEAAQPMRAITWDDVRASENPPPRDAENDEEDDEERLLNAGLGGAARSSSWVAPRAPTPHSCVKNGGAPEESDEEEDEEEDAAKSDESSPAKSDGDPAPAAIMTAAAARELLMRGAAAAGSTDSLLSAGGAGGGAVPPVQPMPRRSPVVGSKADGSASKSTGKSSVRSGPAEEAEVEVMGVDSPADNGGKASGSTRSAGKKTSSSARGAAKSGGSSAKKSNGKSPIVTASSGNEAGGKLAVANKLEAAAPPLSMRADDGSFPYSRTDTLDQWEWCKLQPSGQTPKGRWGHQAVSLGGCLYVMGGDDLTDSDDDILRGE